MSNLVGSYTISVVGLDQRTVAALEETVKRCRGKFSGSITVHLKEGIAQEVETLTKKRLNKS